MFAGIDGVLVGLKTGLDLANAIDLRRECRKESPLALRRRRGFLKGASEAKGAFETGKWILTSGR